MIQDREQLLTPKAGQLFCDGGATEYGTEKYDLKSTTYGRNPAVGEPLEAFLEVVDADVDNATSIAFSIVADDDGAGTNEVVLVTKSFALASLTVASGLQSIGVLTKVGIAATNQYLTAKAALTGSNPSQGKIRVILKKASHGAPNNQAVKV